LSRSPAQLNLNNFNLKQSSNPAFYGSTDKPISSTQSPNTSAFIAITMAIGFS
jgi:hypothetical protein